mmetsp:Transcript_58556/g.171331  ORF Transcript_58556/g.171331 Transcript_58556/m.171331 type:complete len:840 (-) Transcript_58556:186-2705(-)
MQNAGLSPGILGLLFLTFLEVHHVKAGTPTASRPWQSIFTSEPALWCSLLQVHVSISSAPCKLCKKPILANYSIPVSAVQPPLVQETIDSTGADSHISVLPPVQKLSVHTGTRSHANSTNQTVSNLNAAMWPSGRMDATATSTAQQVVHTMAQQAPHGRSGLSTWAWIGIGVVIFFGLLLFLALMIVTWLLSKKGIRRQLHFWWHVYPIYQDYIRTIRSVPEGAPDDELDKALEPLHSKYAPRVLDVVLEMGGIFVKFAQGMSAMPDKLPQAYREQFAKCTTQCKAMPIHEVKAVVEAELGSIRSMRDLCGLCMPGSGASAFDSSFSSFDEKPIGAASIGQVHRACLRDQEGRSVVVKVQRPGARDIFQADVSCLVTLGEWAEKETKSSWGLMAAKEFDKQIQQEFDYLQEARNIDTMREVLLPRFADRIELPEVVHEMTSERMLTMTFLEGEGLDKPFRARVASAGIDANKVLKFMSTLGDGDEGEDKSAEAPSREADCCDSARSRTSADGSLPVAAQGASPPPEPAVDYKQVIDTLLDVYGFCVLAKGIYNADPHPGNVLLMPDGRLGLLDFGQVKHMQEESRVALADVITGILAGDQARAVAAMNRVGMKYTSSDPDLSHDDISWHQALWLWGKLAIIPFPAHIKVVEALGENSKDMPMVVRTTLILRGVALAFGHWVSIAEVWTPWAASSPEEAERLKALTQALDRKNLSGTWSMTHQSTGEEVTWTFRHPPGQQFFFATQGDSHRGWPNGHIRGRSVEWKCTASGSLWRGSLENDGEHLLQVQHFAPDEKYMGVHTGVLASGKVGRAVNTAKGVSSTVCFAFAAARAARRKKPE